MVGMQMGDKDVPDVGQLLLTPDVTVEQLSLRRFAAIDHGRLMVQLDQQAGVITRHIGLRRGAKETNRHLVHHRKSVVAMVVCVHLLSENDDKDNFFFWISTKPFSHLKRVLAGLAVLLCLWRGATTRLPSTRTGHSYIRAFGNAFISKPLSHSSDHLASNNRTGLRTRSTIATRPARIMSIAASTQALARLEPYLLLAKSAKNAAAAKLVAEATAAPGCYVFSELFDCDGIRALADDERYASSYRLLQLFAYGTVSDYVSSAPGTYPTLNVAQEEKLRHLTLISLASKRRTLSYSTLTSQLGLTTDSTDPSARTAASSAGPSRTIHARTMRRLEDVIIGAIYSGIVSARLDQLRQRVEVESVMGRDIVGTEQLAGLATALHDW